MAISPRIVKRRIKSVRSTGKIMKAMELVAASKMRKAVQLALASRPYASLIQELTQELRTALVNSQDPILYGHKKSSQTPVRTLAVVIASDRGLCGGYNSQLLKKAAEFLRSRPQDEVRVVTMGSRAERGIRRQSASIVAAFPSLANNLSFTASEPLLRFVLDEFTSGRVDRVFVVYTDFKSALSQIPTALQLLPIMPEAELGKNQADIELEEEEQDEREEEESDEEKKEKKVEDEGTLLFEPSAPRVFAKLLPRLIETRLYQTLLESTASEQSARMMAMRSAGEAARDMVKDLTLVLNQARQAAITQEISEISAGKAAIE